MASPVPKPSQPTSGPSTNPPYRQIRALYDDDTITLYQAYSPSIALAAVASQKLSASPDFQFTRMTWIKPSWCWMMYRSGYALKDKNQTHILALRMKHIDFEHLLSLSSLSTADKKKDVRVQWDPERSVALGRLDWRSIQIGVGRAVVEWWVGTIVSIEDVTERARQMKALIDERRREEAETLMPMEREYVLGEELRAVVGIE